MSYADYINRKLSTVPPTGIAASAKTLDLFALESA